MMEVLMILLAISIIGIWAFVVYMNHLNKRIDKLEPKIEILQYQTDDVLHDIDVVNRNVIQYCASLKRLEDEKIDAAQNFESLWHDAYEEPQGEYKIICQDEFEHVWITDWREVVKQHASGREEYATCECIVNWVYISDITPKGGKK